MCSSDLVTDKTCDIVTPAGKDFTVTLPTVSKQTLAAAGNVAGRTPFQIKLANCSEGKVATYFEPGATVDFNTGRLLNQDATGAKNVNVQLLGSNNNFILDSKDCSNKSNRTMADCLAANLEATQRDAATIEWMRQAFATADRKSTRLNSSH